MPLTYAVEHQFAVLLGRGVVTGAELRSNLAAVLARLRHAEAPLVLCDLREVGSLELEVGGVAELCAIVAGAGPAAKGARFAIAAEAVDVVRLVEGFEQDAAGASVQVRLFEDIDAARNWLAFEELSG
jgi:hypothetical protein